MLLILRRPYSEYAVFFLIHEHSLNQVTEEQGILLKRNHAVNW